MAQIDTKKDIIQFLNLCVEYTNSSLQRKSKRLIDLNEEELNGNTNFVVGEKNMNLIFKSKNYIEFSKFYK